VRGSKRSTGPGIARVTPFKVPDFDPGTYRISIRVHRRLGCTVRYQGRMDRGVARHSQVRNLGEDEVRGDRRTALAHGPSLDRRPLVASLCAPDARDEGRTLLRRAYESSGASGREPGRGGGTGGGVLRRCRVPRDPAGGVAATHHRQQHRVVHHGPRLREPGKLRHQHRRALWEAGRHGNGHRGHR
jgi:hypothetical protein